MFTSGFSQKNDAIKGMIITRIKSIDIYEGQVSV